MAAPRERSIAAACSPSSASITGSRNSDPALARSVFGFHRATVPFTHTSPAAPNASAARATVPALPGS